MVPKSPVIPAVIGQLTAEGAKRDGLQRVIKFSCE